MYHYFIHSLLLFISINISTYSEVYDCFLFFNELDILEIRLNELYNSIDKFVLVESEETFMGSEKPLYYDKNKARFEKFSDKIIHIIIKERFVNTGNPWIIEEFQRNQIMQGLVDCSPDDIILISDVDEIPKRDKIPEIIEMVKTGKYPLHCVQPIFRFYLNALELTSNWTGTCASTYKYLQGTTPNIFRHERKTKDYFVIHNSGWHFTSQGGMQCYREKLESFSHPEENTTYKRSIEFIESSIKYNACILDRQSDLPMHIKNNWEYYKSINLIINSHIIPFYP